MDPVSVIEIALAAGASAGIKTTASTAVADAYQGLKEGVQHLFAGKPRAEMVLAAHEESPPTWKAPLIAELEAAGVDDELLAAAHALLHMIDPSGSRHGKYTIYIQDSRNIQIGDGTTQYNCKNRRKNTSGAGEGCGMSNDTTG